MGFVTVTGPKRGGHAAWFAIRRALTRLGVPAKRLVPGTIHQVSSALILAGGKHVHPSMFREAPIHRGRSYDPPRDVLETAAFNSVRERGGRILPWFAARRGCGWRLASSRRLSGARTPTSAPHHVRATPRRGSE